MEWLVLVSVVLVLICNFFFFRYLFKPQVINNTTPTQVNVNLKPLQDSIDALPNKVLQSITSSTNTHKGAVGEMIGYLKLHATYDRIIPLSDIADFLCIRFATETDPGCVHFIDIKTGKARLSAEQREMKKLIQDKKVDFIKLSVQTHNPDDC